MLWELVESRLMSGGAKSPNGSARLWRFDTFRVDLQARKLWNGDRPVPLTPKVFAVFAFLLSNRDRIVSKRELFDAVWEGRIVEETNLTQSISVLRKALGETNAATKYIATFPGVGYRFIAEAVEDDGPAPLSATEAGLIRTPARAPTWRWMATGAAVAVAAVAFAAWRMITRQPAAVFVGRSRPVTHLPGREYQPAISPDGSRVAFTYHGELNGPLRVGVVELEGGADARLPAPDQGDMFSPAWGPDSRRLAYIQQRGGRLQIVIEEANGDRVPAGDISAQGIDVIARQLDWSPDGRILAVTNKPANDEPFRIELIHIRERRRTTLTVPPALSDGDFEPRFSPDGSRLAFLRQNSRGVAGVLVVTLPSSEPVAVTDERGAFTGIDWSPDSRSLVVSGEADGVHRLWRIPLGGGRSAWQATTRTASGPMQFSISRKTGRLALALSEADYNIWGARLSAGRAAIRWERVIDSTSSDYFPVFSPDGKRFAFVSERSGERQIWLKEDGKSERQLTFGDMRPAYASWTGNSEEIVFSSLGHRTLHRLRVNDGKAERIPLDGTVGTHTAVSPDGAEVFMARRFYIFQASAEGGPRKLLTDEGGFPLRLSPDGAWIYYALHRFSNQIWRLHRPSGRTERVTDRLQTGCWACWSTDGRTLVYVTDESRPHGGLERLDIATGRPEPAGVLPGRVPPLGLGTLALAAGSSAVLAVVAEPGVGDVELVDVTPWQPAAAGRN